ncbi:MAG: hypothetical protein AB1599_05170 [Planctomycetota bacterium]
MLIFKIIKVLRIITVCLIVFLALDYFLNWGLIKAIADYNKDILIVGAILFFVTYLVASWIMIFVRFRYMNRRPPSTNQAEDETTD